MRHLAPKASKSKELYAFHFGNSTNNVINFCRHFGMLAYKIAVYRQILLEIDECELGGFCTVSH